MIDGFNFCSCGHPRKLQPVYFSLIVICRSSSAFLLRERELLYICLLDASHRIYMYRGLPARISNALLGLPARISNALLWQRLQFLMRTCPSPLASRPTTSCRHAGCVMALNASVGCSDGHRRFDRGERTSRFRTPSSGTELKYCNSTMDSLHMGSIFCGSNFCTRR